MPYAPSEDGRSLPCTYRATNPARSEQAKALAPRMQTRKSECIATVVTEEELVVMVVAL
jgi:hypothetical protein